MMMMVVETMMMMMVMMMMTSMRMMMMMQVEAEVEVQVQYELAGDQEVHARGICQVREGEWPSYPRGQLGKGQLAESVLRSKILFLGPMAPARPPQGAKRQSRKQRKLYTHRGPGVQKKASLQIKTRSFGVHTP